MEARSGKNGVAQLMQEMALLRQEVAELKQEKAERKRAEEEVEESKELYRALVEAGADMGEAIVLLQNRDKVEAAHLFANQEWERMTGYSVEELREISYFALVHPRDRDAVAERNRRRLGGEDVRGPWEISIIAKDGTELPVEATGATLTYQGRPAVVGYIRDITERKRVEEELEESKERYRALVEAGANIGEGIILSQNTDKVEAAHLFANQEWERMTGYSVEELREISYLDLIHPRHRDGVANRVRRRFQGELLPGPWEVSIIAKDGTELPVEATATPITYQGRPAVVAYIRDISERKRAEERVHHLNLVLRAIRSVNQVIARETDRSRLLKGICRSLTEARGYYDAWIALLDESGELREYAESGLGDDFLPMKERLERGELTHCARRALEQFSPIVTENPPVDCSDCPLSGNYKGRGALTTRLQHGARCYGIMALSIPAELLSDDGEVVLCREVADDIAFALGSLELEERHKKAAEDLKESEERYRALVEAGADMGEAIVLLQNTDKVRIAHLFVNDEWVRMTGYSLEELREISYIDLVHPRDRDAAAERNRRRLQGELLPGPWEISIIAKDGTELPVEATGATLTYQGRPAVVGYIRDITERKRAEGKLKAALEEKEVLLKEVHHRVKNNLQVISSLLNLQSGYIDDERYAEMFKDSQERVKSMALVHEKLYQSEDLAKIDFAGYIESVVQELCRSYGAERAGIGIKTEVENIRLGVDYAIPCGLMVNELVSNSLKHAFPSGKRGEVKTAVRQVGRDEVELEVSDNGTGLPESVDVRNVKSLGLRLVSILAEDQLGGEMELDRTEGTRFRIRFRVGE